MSSSSSILTAEEIAFLDKINKQKQKHNEAQAKYKASKADEIKVYNQNYHKQKRIQLQEINNKLLMEPTPTPINIQQITEIPKIDKRARRGKKQALTVDIKPIYETRKEPLELSTIKAYLDKANIINKIFKKSPLSQEVKAELKKLLNDNPNLNEPLILAEMDYIKKDIESTIQTLRTHYKNDNSFKNYMNILVVISSHLKSVDKNIYQTLTKTNIFINKEIQSKREDNEVAPKDEGKIIDLDKTTILTNIQKLDNIDDRYCMLYTL